MSRVFLFRLFHLLIPPIHRRIHIEHFEFAFHICRLTHAKNYLPTVLENGIDCFVDENGDGVCCGVTRGSSGIWDSTDLSPHKVLCKITGTIVLLIVIIAIVVDVFGVGGVGSGMRRRWCRCSFVMIATLVRWKLLLLLVEKMVTCVVVLLIFCHVYLFVVIVCRDVKKAFCNGQKWYFFGKMCRASQQTERERWKM